MIYIGDIAVPKGIIPHIENLPDTFQNQLIIANLEEPIAGDKDVSLMENKVFSNHNVLGALKSLKVQGVSLANNHMMDVPVALNKTIDTLDKNNIRHTGAGINLRQARTPMILNEDGQEYVFLDFGWDIISCVYAGKVSPGVNPLESNNIFKSIEKVKENLPEAKIVTLMHWDYELEKFPMPAHRRLAKEMIDRGVDFVIGHHPHCVQGIEIYKDCPIIYSLGNWFVPDGVFMGGRTVFPDYCKDEMAVEFKAEKMIIHQFMYSPDGNCIKFVESMEYENSSWIKEKTPFAGLTDEEYGKWFREHRVKKKLLPVFNDTTNTIETRYC